VSDLFWRRPCKRLRSRHRFFHSSFGPQSRPLRFPVDAACQVILYLKINLAPTQNYFLVASIATTPNQQQRMGKCSLAARAHLVQMHPNSPAMFNHSTCAGYRVLTCTGHVARWHQLPSQRQPQNRVRSGAFSKAVLMQKYRPA
jgi:hypothetical protein